MPKHWTYAPFSEESDLLQGDILEPTEELRSVLKAVHPHFLDAKYNAFLLITQSCDLVIRNKRCGTRYLVIAVVRPLESVIHDCLSHVCRTIAEGIYLQETKWAAKQLLQRIFNQNEQTLGLFYLHPDSEAGINIPSVALLRVTVTLRAEHYDVLRNCRRGRLGTEFRNKLGWLVGNLYSRIGTEDWSEPQEREKELEKYIKQFLDGGEAMLNSPNWFPESWVNAAKEKGIQLDTVQLDDLPLVLKSCKPKEVKELAIEQVIRVIHEVLPDIDEANLSRLGKRLANDALFKGVIRKGKMELD
jgi:hypothetical protein